MNRIFNSMLGKLFLLIVLVVSSINGVYAQDLSTARNYTRSERFENAEAEYKELIKKEPGNADLYYYYGENIIKQYIADTFSITKKEALKNSLTIFNKGFAADSNNALNIVGIGMVELMRNGDTVAADKWFRRAESKVPAKAAKCLEKDVKVLINLGVAQIYGKNKRYDKALKYLNKAKEATVNKKTGLGSNAEVFFAIGDVCLSNNQHSDAIKNYRTALSINSKFVEAQLRIGYLYLGAKNLKEARSAFEEAKEIDSSFAPVYRGLGEVYSKAGLYKFSNDCYKKFLILSGDNTPAKVSYAVSLYKSESYDEALKTIDEVIALDNSRNYLNRLGAYSCYEKKNQTPQDLEKGLMYIEKFFSNTDPDKILASDYSYYGKIQIKLKKDTVMLKNGIDNLFKAYEFDSTETGILNEIVKSSYYNGIYDKTVKALNIKIARNIAKPADVMMLGKSYFKMKDYINADRIFTEIYNNDNSNMEALVWIANTAADQDPGSKQGLAKDKYENVIKLGVTDTTKYSGDLFNAYSYMASYYLQVKKDYSQTKVYAQKILDLDKNKKEYLVRGYSYLSAIYVALKDYQSVKQVYQKLLGIDPNNNDYKKMIEWADKGIESKKTEK